MYLSFSDNTIQVTSITGSVDTGKLLLVIEIPVTNDEQVKQLREVGYYLVSIGQKDELLFTLELIEAERNGSYTLTFDPESLRADDGTLRIQDTLADVPKKEMPAFSYEEDHLRRWLADNRGKINLTQHEIAEHIGVTWQKLHRYLLGYAPLPPQNFTKLQLFMREHGYWS